ncbi:MAG: hypothetical protein WCG80_13575 [Spirochaetales bacterium]
MSNALKVNLVCYEDVNQWILGKFARRMNEILVADGHDVTISTKPDHMADINHHIIYYDYKTELACACDTLMITHIDTVTKLSLLKDQLRVASAGICMSQETRINLIEAGIDQSKLHVVNPAHDGIIPIKKKYFGITCRVQNDGRKREHLLVRLSQELDPAYFGFIIMGDGWEPCIKELEETGFNVEFHRDFQPEIYAGLFQRMDYYLYMGLDEGQMGFVDACAAGIETLVTDQGYHQDAKGGMTFPFLTEEELLAIARELQSDRRQLVESVAGWNWQSYTDQHVQIWRQLLSGVDNTNLGFAGKPKLRGVLKQFIHVFRSPVSTFHRTPKMVVRDLFLMTKEVFPGLQGVWKWYKSWRTRRNA